MRREFALLDGVLEVGQAFRNADAGPTLGSIVIAFGIILIGALSKYPFVAVLQ